MSRLFGEELVSLAVAMAHLGDGSAVHARLAEPHAVMAARDSVVRGLAQTLSEIVTGRDELPDCRPLGPALTLVRELRSSARLEPDRGPLTVGTLAGVDARWASACAAAVAMEEHCPQLRRLQADAAWTVTQDLARLARLVPTLDSDLLERLERRADAGRSRRSKRAQATLDDRVDSLRGQVTANRLAETADRLLTRLAGRPADDQGLTLSVEHDRPLIPRRAADAPAALRRLTHLLDRAPDLGMRDLTMTSWALARVAHSTARVTVQDHAKHLVDIERACAQLALSRRSWTSPVRLPSIDIQAESLGTLPMRPGQLSSADVSAIVGAVGPAGVALTRAIHRSLDRGTLLLPPEDSRSQRLEHLDWVPPTESRERVVMMKAAAAELLRSSRALERVPAGIIERAYRAAPIAPTRVRHARAHHQRLGLS